MFPIILLWYVDMVEPVVGWEVIEEEVARADLLYTETASYGTRICHINRVNGSVGTWKADISVPPII